MHIQFNFPQDDDDQIVYVRSVDPADLPDDIRDQIDGDGPVYAIHTDDGERIALARDRNVAFALARNNEMVPMSVH